MADRHNAHQITLTVRVVVTDREWIVQKAKTRRTRRQGSEPTSEWTNRAHATSRSMLDSELKHLVGAKGNLLAHVGQDARGWLNGLPVRHPSREAQAGLRDRRTVLERLEASAGSEHGETFHDHLPLTWRNGRNARFDP